MKTKLYQTFYYLFSYLSDKTNGASIVVKYKLILGSLLIGLTVTSCDKDKEDEPEVSCYLTTPEKVQTKPTSPQSADTLIVSKESFNKES